ncbi:MAG: sulfite exporter TauE/SafE family protein [Acidobacteriota bacterium]|nr:sulfite exporter TauE/SafE family protein [Acidobacteriota bacterium]
MDLASSLLPVLFFLVALLYSAVGLGGGSSYAALMAIFGVSAPLIPATALLLNLVVTSMGAANFLRAGHQRPLLIAPFLLGSMPMAYLGGTLDLPVKVFEGLLLASLVGVAMRIYFVGELRVRHSLAPTVRLVLAVGTGSALGFIAGAVGIGGGIYLVPLLIVFDLATEKEAAAAGTIFVFLNSAAGLAARLQYVTFETQWILPLVAAVVAGGFLGSHMGSARLRPRTIQQILGVIVLVAIGFLLRRFIA